MPLATDKVLEEATSIAQFRFALIAPVIQGLFPDTSRTAYYKRITENDLTLPNGKKIHYQYKTIEKWVSDYKRGGFDALMPKLMRSDKGATRRLPEEAVDEIYNLKEQYPRINATQIYNKLVHDGIIPATISVRAVQRFVKSNDLKSASNPNLQNRKAFEEIAFGRMWQADTCYFPHITEDGKSRRVYCIMIIDDYSRLIVGGGLFYNDNAYNFQKVLKQAVATYGIPIKLYVDNGCSYSNNQLSLICGSIGTVLLHTKIRDGASKGKVERHFRTLKETWLYTLDIENIHSLSEFNEMLAEYVRTYNIRFHSGIQCAPYERYEQTCGDIKMPVSREWLEESFQNRITRKVRKDATVSIDKISYDVPMQFIGMKVEIRYVPDDMTGAYILYEKEHYPIRKTNKFDNCYTKRNNAVIDYSKAGD